MNYLNAVLSWILQKFSHLWPSCESLQIIFCICSAESSFQKQKSLKKKYPYWVFSKLEMKELIQPFVVASVPGCYNAKDKNRQQGNISFCAFCSFTNWALSVHRWEKHKRGKKDQRQLGRLDRQLLLEQWYKRSEKKKNSRRARN